MEFQEKLSSNLTLHNTETQQTDSNEQAVTVEFNFTFFGEYCRAVMHRDKLDIDWPSFVFTEAPCEVADSFVDQLENVHWEKLVDCFCRHQDDHNREWGTNQSE